MSTYSPGVPAAQPFERNLARLIRGELEIGGRRVDVDNVTMPVLNVDAERDDLIPPASSIPLGDHVGTDDYTATSFDVGHIGMYVSGRVQRELPAHIAGWLADPLTAERAPD